ncbi:hypothetical protein C2R22_18590 [Salinigranum rubrum]|uniref:Uncharacterized protein n=1 Tax=Salinigranum rubrum TaxID=755307 RepID=A0A2I8VNA4_9EURY|nr:hypothetical protein [Salinigranum rubrum]AUV83403.1 hypothetical protein C2R22_18590 [Salinigranum rubrum]
MDLVERFGARVDVSTTTAAVGYFLVCRRPSADHAQFRGGVASAVGGAEYIHLDNPNGFVVVATAYVTAQALRAHPMVDHVGGVTLDSNRLLTSTGEHRTAAGHES